MMLGAIIAGGRSTRYGAPKTLARVGGVPILERVLRVLRPNVDGCIAIINDADIAAAAAALGVPTRPDIVTGAGAIGGIHAALHWADELAAPALLVVGGDTPLLTPALLAALVDIYAMTAADVVAPESDGPRGIEPLCAVYAVTCLPAIDSAIARGDHRLIGFHDDVRVERMPLAAVREHGDPAELFLNVNTPADRALAESLVAGAHHG
jgi:molybdenum cofactor guanylyltransferase